ncbi:MAG: hypothetical protein NVS4B3_17100 [Gemmatimonadaceae bacterium]
MTANPSKRAPAPPDVGSVTGGPQVLGGNILSMLAAMGPFRKTGEQILIDLGITSVAADRWYSLDAYVGALGMIEEKIGPNTLFRVGCEIPNYIPLPPGLDTFESVAAAFAPAFAMNHRGARAGGITHVMVGPMSARITSGTPYPCDFDRGVVEGLFRKLLGGGWHFGHDPASCKKTGGALCTHLVSRIGAPG